LASTSIRNTTEAAQRAAIDANDQAVVTRQCCHRGLVRPIALVDPVGNIKRGAPPHGAQPDDQQRRRGAAINIVVGKDRDCLAPRHGAQKPRRRRPHVFQRQRVWQEVAQLRLQKPRRLGRGHTARHQQARQRQGQVGVLHHRLGQPVGLGPRADPAAPGGGRFDIKESAVVHAPPMPDLRPVSQSTRRYVARAAFVRQGISC
jgi:hypothetical protein